jgi:hypothetical protein
VRTAARVLFVACVAAWAAVAVYSGYGIVRYSVQQVTAPRASEVQQRAQTWSPIYGFAAACAAKLPAGATVVLFDPTVTEAGVSTLPTDRGPAAYGAPAEIDWPNAATFAYVTYPHVLFLRGYVPTDWSVSVTGVDYIAVWEQATFRGPDAQADAKSLASALSQAAAPSKRCDYSDTAGDAGVMFAVGPQSVAFGDTRPTEPAGLTPSSVVRAVAAIASLWIAGLIVLFAVRRTLGWPLLIAMALPAGAAAVALEMLIFSLAGVRWSAPGLAAPWLGVALAVAALQRRVKRRAREVAAPGGAGRLSPLEWVGLIALAAWVLLVTAPAPLGLPFSDGFDFYFFKARAFFTDGTVIRYYASPGMFLFSLPAHPPLIPLAVTWLYLVMGGVEEHAVLLLWPALYVSLVLAFFGFIRRHARRVFAIWYTLAFALIATELAKAAAEPSFTDFPLALYLFLAVGSLWTWNRGGRTEHAWLVVGGIFLGAAALTKEEGLVASAVVLFVSLLFPASGAGRLLRWWPTAVTAVVWLVVVSPWIYLRFRHALPVETVSLTGSAGSVLRRVPTIVVGLAGRSAVHVIPAAVLLVAMWAARAANRKRLISLVSAGGLFLTGILLGQLAGDVLGMATSRVEVHLQLQIAGTRLLSQLLPVFLFALFWVWSALAEEAAELGLLRGWRREPPP